jgi:hypothetical protein
MYIPYLLANDPGAKDQNQEQRYPKDDEEPEEHGQQSLHVHGFPSEKL